MQEERMFDKETGRVCVIPAAPLWYSVSLFIGANPGEEELYRNPIVAWRVETSLSKQAGRSRPELISHAVPICVEGEVAYAAILSPDGAVFLPEVQAFKNIEEFIEYERDRQQRSASV